MKKIKLYVLLILIYFGVLWAWLQYSVSSIFTYWDEALAILALPVIIACIYKIRQRNLILILLLFFLFLVCGIFGNIIFRYASITTMLSDIFINIKFFACFLFSIVFFLNFDFKKYEKKLHVHINFLTFLIFLFFVINCVTNIFSVYEVRFGFESKQLFYPHPTFCAAAVYFLLMIRVLFSNSRENKKMVNVFINTLLCLIIISTLRFKAIASVMLFLAIILSAYSKTVYRNRWMLYVIGAIGAVLLSYKQIAFYFTGYGLAHFPRGALLVTSIKIIVDYLPIGTGFGTFGSYISGVHYSPIYQMYGINNIDGISVNNYNAITDQYWPMIAGQTGLIGIILMAAIWILLFDVISKVKKNSMNDYIVGLSCLSYILISSTSESAICNPTCIPFAFILGIIVAKNSKEKRKIK